MSSGAEQPATWSHHAYSWHQSHDQATVLLTVPADVKESDVEITLERDYIIAGIRGHDPVVKGRLYGPVDPTGSVWQLEPRSVDRPLRERVRTASVISTVSSQSSFAYVSSEPDVSSSLAASVEHLSSDWDNPTSLTSSPWSSPRVGSSGEEQLARPSHIRRTSSGHAPATTSLGVPSSYASSVDSLHGDMERLLTLHLEKVESSIWASLIVGPAPLSIPLSSSDPGSDAKYNMDVTSLTLTGLELYDIRKKREDAFGYFARAWRQGHVPTAALRLVTHFVPPESTTARPAWASVSGDLATPGPLPETGSTDFYVHVIGGPHFLAQLYLDVGLLHLDGVAPTLLATSSSAHSLSSLRLPGPFSGNSTLLLSGSTRTAQEWRVAREHAAKCFARARELWPQLNVPTLPPEDNSDTINVDLQMPSMDLYGSASEDETVLNPRPPMRRRRTDRTESGNESKGTKPEPQMGRSKTILHDSVDEHPWYLYAPGLVGAGTALVAVAVVGALSFTTWRRQN